MTRAWTLLHERLRTSEGSRRSLIGASLMILQPLALNALSLPVTAFIIATLGPLDYGSWSVALMLTTTAGLLANIGLRSLLIRTVARTPEDAPRVFAEHLAIRLTLMLVGGALALVACRLLGYPTIVLTCTAILVVGMLFTGAGNVVSDLLQGLERLPSLATINMVAGLMLTVASLVAIGLGAGPIGLAVSYLVGPIVTGVTSLMFVQRRLFPVRLVWDIGRFSDLLKQSRHLGVPQMFGMLGYETESLLVPKLVGIYDFGHFAAGVLLPRRLLAVPDGLITAFFPVLTRKFHTSADDTFAVVKRFTFFLVIACVPAALVLTLLADPIAGLLFREEREACRMVLQLTAWMIPVLGFEGGLGYLLTAAGREKEEARLSVIRAVIGVGLSVALIWGFGLLGACIASLAKGVLGVMIRVPYVLNTLRSYRAATLSPATAGVNIP